MSTALARAAFCYALRGLAVFPLAPGSKVPLAGGHGCNDASTDPDVARGRWQSWPSANIGAATGSRSGIWVLDVDAHHDGNRVLTELEAKHGPLPLTVEASTPQGGRHLYWRWNAEGPEIRNSAGRIGPGVDVRGEGGYITLPPSELANGRDYKWVQNQANFSEAPAWLVEAALSPPPPPRPMSQPLADDVSAYVASAAVDELRQLEEAVEGVRNDTLNRVAFNLGQLVRAGALHEDWARRQLEIRAISIGLSATEAHGTIESAFRAAQPRELPR